MAGTAVYAFKDRTTYNESQVRKGTSRCAKRESSCEKECGCRSGVVPPTTGMEAEEKKKKVGEMSWGVIAGGELKVEKKGTVDLRDWHGCDGGTPLFAGAGCLRSSTSCRLKAERNFCAMTHAICITSPFGTLSMATPCSCSLLSCHLAAVHSTCSPSPSSTPPLSLFSNLQSCSSGASALASGWVATKIGLINTMVFT